MMGDTVQLDEITGWIDGAFAAGDDVVLEVAAAGYEDVLRGLFGDDGFRRYLRDELNRQIIRDYLTNAVVLGVVSRDGLAAFAAPIATEEGRATLALYMLMSAVDEAAELVPLGAELTALKPLAPVPGDRSHIKLVPN